MLIHPCNILLRNFRGMGRNYSKLANQYLNVTNTGKGYSILEMNKGPVNSLNVEMLQEFTQAIDALEKDETCRGVIVTSNLPVFSSGLDILEMYQPNVDKLKLFWLSVQNLKLKIVSTPLVMVAAINGPCLAAGCAFVMSFDSRIMAAGKHQIGITGTLLGVSPPWWMYESLRNAVGEREVEKMLSLSLLYTSDEAFKKGIVDQVVPQEEVLAASETEMKKWLTIPDNGRIATKHLMRKQFIEEFLKRRDEDYNMFLDIIQRPVTQDLIQKYLSSLKRK